MSYTDARGRRMGHMWNEQRPARVGCQGGIEMKTFSHDSCRYIISSRDECSLGVITPGKAGKDVGNASNIRILARDMNEFHHEG